MILRLIRNGLQIVGLLTVIGAAGFFAAALFLAPWLQHEDVPERASHVVVLAGDYARVLRAADLVKEGLAPTVLLSRERYGISRIDAIDAEMGRPAVDPTEYRIRLLGHLGVPRNVVVPFGSGSISTVDEAKALAAFLPNASGTIILVTSPYHARRAKMIFKRAMPGVRWLVVCPTEGRLPDRWWTDQAAARNALLEAGKLLFLWSGLAQALE